MVCIDVDDPDWTDLVNNLMPGHDWDTIRRAGLKPVALGIALRPEMQRMMTECVPSTANGFQERFVGDDAFLVGVFACGGASVYRVHPTEQKKGKGK